MVRSNLCSGHQDFVWQLKSNCQSAVKTALRNEGNMRTATFSTLFPAKLEPNTKRETIVKHPTTYPLVICNIAIENGTFIQ
jgi:hypothetical protein